MKNIYLPAKLLPGLLICAIPLMLNACGGVVGNSSDDVESTFSGSLGDGPIVDATVMIYNKKNRLIKVVTSYDNATYLTRIRARRRNYPLTIEVEDGFDLVTNMAPDFKLLSVTLNRSVKNINVNPFSTMIVEAAYTASGSLSKESISTARSAVISQMNFGLDSAFIANPINTPITTSNVAVITKSSEAMGEMIRRVRDNMIISGADIDGNDVVAALADDISDGIIDGVGGDRVNPRISALSKLVSAQVLIEALSNNLKVQGEIATSKLDIAIMDTHPSVGLEQLTDNVTINSEMLEQTRSALYAAQTLVPSAELGVLSDIVDSIPANSMSFDIETVMPSGSSNVLEPAIAYVLFATNEELERVNNADITQKPVNTAPQLSGTPPSSVLENSDYLFIPNANDADGDALEFTISNKPSWVSFNSADGRLAGTPGTINVGVYNNIVISVSDGLATDSIEPFSITVNNINDAPLISGSPITSVEENSPYSFQPSATDQDGDNLAFSILGQPSWAAFNNSTGQLSGTPNASNVGTYNNIQISVSDGIVSSSLPAFSIIVNASEPVNTVPTISGIPSAAAFEDSIYTFQPDAFDADGDALTFSISNRPAWASFNASNGQLAGTPDNGDLGTYSNINISVSDGIASVSTGSFSITVNNTNDAPLISGSPITSVEENGSYSFQPSASDQDGDSLVFSITGQPVWASFDSSNGHLSGTPAEGDAGIYSNIVISVSDGSVTAALPAFSIQVNTAQVPTDMGSFTISWTEPVSRVDNTELFSSDIDSYSIYYGTTPGYYPNSVDAASSEQAVTVTDLPAGTYYAVMTTIDTEGRESSYSQEITVDVK